MVAGLRCPTCRAPLGEVTDSRPSPLGIRRRRVCQGCGQRTTTVEIAVSQVGPMVIHSGHTSRPYVEPLAPYLRRLQASIQSGIGASIDHFFGSLKDLER